MALWRQPLTSPVISSQMTILLLHISCVEAKVRETWVEDFQTAGLSSAMTLASEGFGFAISCHAVEPLE